MLSPTIKAITLLVCCSLAFGAVAQTADTVRASVGKSTWGVQPGFLGIWAHNELWLTDQIVLRTEAGVHLALRWSKRLRSTKSVKSIFWGPMITVEPRWYYNLNKRRRSSKDITGNSGNFISVKAGYIFSGVSVIDELGTNVREGSAVKLVFSWGIRRNIGRHFNYEAGVDVGAVVMVSAINLWSPHLYPHLRIGYRF